ncbi:MAG: O-antigen ligase family protein, partial [Bacteroidales bacterium]|nr:O-antigen ligase family protein [Bacteroidales bacterium]
MFKDRKNIWAIAITLLFLAINLILIAFNNYYLNFLPFVIIILFLALFSLDNLLYLTVFLVPFSVPLRYFIPNLPIDFYIPTEPILFGLLLIFIYKLLLGQKLDKRILLHPVSIVIYFNLLWIFFTSVTSTMPIVSLKFFLARLWYVIGFYFLAIQLFKKYQNTEKYVWLYLIPFIIIVLYDLVNLGSQGFFNQKAAHSAMRPFYNDHTSYGAIVSMFIPVIIYFASNKENKFIGYKTLTWLLAGLFLFALVMSYSRAAWVSVISAIFIWIIVKLKIKFRTLLIFIAIAAIYLASFLPQIIMNLEKNKQESSADFAEHVQSISNIKSDASNVERLNRWACAFQMFKEKPIVGWGPGTYMFKYAPYQFSYNRTIISTNTGDLGNAHSEYIGPLAESGVIGSITFILIVVYLIITA